MARNGERLLEEYLVAGARMGDQKAAAQLVELRGPRLLGHAMRLLRDRDDALDAVQDAWVEIFRGLKGLRDERAFAAWAYRIVTRRAARVVARNARERKVARDWAAEIDLAIEEDGPLAADARAVRAAIRDLPPDQAATVALFYLDEMSVAEVAVALDVPPGTVKTRLMHARQKLHDALKGGSDEQT